MNIKILIAVAILTLILFAGFYYKLISFEKIKKPESVLYQGAVPEGYDLDCFRHSGKTIKIGEVC